MSSGSVSPDWPWICSRWPVFVSPTTSQFLPLSVNLPILIFRSHSPFSFLLFHSVSLCPPPPPLHLPIIFLCDPRGLCAELTCHESFGQQLLNIPSLPAYLALVIALLLFFSVHPSLSRSPPSWSLCEPLSPSAFVFFPSLYDVIHLFYPPFVFLGYVFDCRTTMSIIYDTITLRDRKYTVTT